ncbi:MAG: glycosyltransferase family 2 protein [Candidatus Omnitrophota bacterium]
MQKRFSVIIPAYNEELGLKNTLKNLKLGNFACEIIVVDDGSRDNTVKIAEQAEVKVIVHPYNKGYGAALKTGVRAATAEVVIFMDADGQHNPEDLPALLKHIDEYDMVVGARGKNSQNHLLRSPGKKVLSLIANYLSGMKIPDLNSGFRAIKRSLVLEFMHILPNTFSFTTTITLAILKGGYNVKYVTITTARRKGKSTVNPARDGIRTILLIINTIVLFDPLKVFIPISFGLFIPGLIYMLQQLLTKRNIPDGALLLIISAILIFFFGILAEQVSQLRRQLK